MKAQTGEASPEKNPDVRRVAFGLAFITHGVKNYSQIAAAAESEANEAVAIIDASIRLGDTSGAFAHLSIARKLL